MKWLVVLSIAVAITVVSATKKQKLSDIIWKTEYFTQSKASLTASLADDRTQAIEAHVVIGTLEGDKNSIPQLIVANSSKVSDLSFEQFLVDIRADYDKRDSVAKIVKLNFDDIDALSQAISYMQSNAQLVPLKLWFSGFVQEGPSADAPKNAIDFDLFAYHAGRFPFSTLSLGWNLPSNTTGLKYSDKNIERMLIALQRVTIIDRTRPISIAIHSDLAVSSADQLKDLYTETKIRYPNTTLNFYGEPHDRLKVIDFINELGANDVYYINQTPINGASAIVQFGVINLFVIGMAQFLRNSQ